MRNRFEDSCNMNILNWKLYWKINSIMTWSSRKIEITSFLPLKREYANYLFPIQSFHVPFMNLQSSGFNFFATIMRGSCVFCVSFNPTNHFSISAFQFKYTIMFFLCFFFFFFFFFILNILMLNLKNTVNRYISNWYPQKTQK